MHEPKSHLPINPVGRRTFSGYLFLSQLRTAIIVTYIFWALFSLVNFDFLAALPLPILLFSPANSYQKFSDFLTEPLLTAALVATLFGIVAGLINRRLYGINPIPYLMPILVNGVFLTAFLVSAERTKNAAIAAAIENRSPDCMVVSSFFDLVRHAGQEFQFHPHAIFTENGKMYHWSYANMSFYEGQEIYNKNFDCYGPRLPVRPQAADVR